ncbi:MAG: hypothetical protein EXR89_03085 [Methylococcaceae bacterium]|nr:hypothetical protein [Methylococcaceae bacterium]
MNKNLTLLSFITLVVVANAITPVISHAAPAKLKEAAFFALWSDMPYVKNGDTTSSSVAAPALDGTTDGTTAISRLTKSINDAKK